MDEHGESSHGSLELDTAKAKVVTVRTEPVQWITPYVPDADILAVIGEVAVKHVHLDHMLKMTIKSLTGVTVDEALAELSRKGSLVLRKKIEKKAKQRLGDCPDLTRLQELLDRCRDASEQRHLYVKSVYAIHLSEPDIGSQAILDADQIWCPIPSVQDMRKLSVIIESLVCEINEARLHGWLRDAIDATRIPAG